MEQTNIVDCNNTDSKFFNISILEHLFSLGEFMKEKLAVILFISVFSIIGHAEDLVTRKYFVKGMTCGGCILGVKVALNKAESLKIEDKEISVGVADLKFSKKNYLSEKTDCEVSKAIEKFTEFKVFMDKGHTKKACKS